MLWADKTAIRYIIGNMKDVKLPFRFHLRFEAFRQRGMALPMREKVKIPVRYRFVIRWVLTGRKKL